MSNVTAPALNRQNTPILSGATTSCDQPPRLTQQKTTAVFEIKISPLPPGVSVRVGGQNIPSPDQGKVTVVHLPKNS